VVQFDATRKTLPRLDMLVVRTGNGDDPERGASTGAAWLSSARAVRCWVKSRNERNPCCQLYFSGETAERNSEEGGDDVKSARPLRLGLHTRYNGRYRGLRKSDLELIPQSRPQFRLQAETRLHEGGVASNRRSAHCGEYVPGPCTHRPSRYGSRQHLKSLSQPQGGRRRGWGG
jgi:hypothetical protein